MNIKENIYSFSIERDRKKEREREELPRLQKKQPGLMSGSLGQAPDSFRNLRIWHRIKQVVTPQGF